jgi:hypothetical protein
MPDQDILSKGVDESLSVPNLFSQKPASLHVLLPIKDISLTAEEQSKIQLYQLSRLVLGPAASAPMICAAEKCPIAKTCPLQMIHKAPQGELCPFEVNYVVERFQDWIRELGRSEASELTATERSSIAQLVVIDIQEQRCLLIMSEGKAASMTDLSVKEIDMETGEALSYEKIVHANQQILDTLCTRRRMILDDMERTEKAKTRRARVTPPGAGKDLSSKQSALGDKIRKAMSGMVIDVEPEPKSSPPPKK